MSARLLALRLAFGALLVVNGINHFAGPFVAEPAGSAPLAFQLMTAVRDSHLLDVVVAIQAVAGLAILADLAVPFALAVAMPVSVCAAFWGVILEQHVAMALIALVMLAANAALMFAHLDAYRGVLQRRALAVGEGPEPPAHYDGLYMNPAGRAPPAFVARSVVLLLAFAFYWFLVPGRTGMFARMTLGLPAVLLLVAGVRGLAARA